MEKVSELAHAATVLRCMGDPVLIRGIANEAARITLPDDVVDAYVAYWLDSGRDVNLGEYIQQIAEYAEALALTNYASLDNGLYAFPRPD